ncbi:MAG: leucine-rich repeat protein, partial [Oscillospiraceae bacterium]|nr:leucine-rich repeat protein [Oscillospiraceae bacterium]
MNIKAKLTGVITALICATNVVAVMPLNVGAQTDTYGILTYEAADADGNGVNDHIVITDCDESATKADIPKEIDGLPVTVIGEKAFSFCEELEEVTIPYGIKTIGYAAFCYCTSVKELIIPDSVTTIESQAFSCCQLVTDIVIPDSVTSFGTHIFFQCFALERVTLPESFTEIGTALFFNCWRLKSYDISPNITKIGNIAFASCINLESIVIPKNVTYIGDGAFYDCPNLQSVTVYNPACEIFDGESALSETAVIYGYENSTAQAYAEKYNKTFVSLGEYSENIIKGDVNYDSVVNLYDAIDIARYIMDIKAFSDEQMNIADYNS